MDFETTTPENFGASLRGIGLNILTRDASVLAQFLGQVFGVAVHRASHDFAIIEHDGMILQLHSDATFADHPLYALLPETAPRGAGVQVYFFGLDPDFASARAGRFGGTVFEPPTDKPHGLREATILAPEGQAFSAALRRE